MPFVKNLQKHLSPEYLIGILQNAEGNAELRAHYLEGQKSKYGSYLRDQLFVAIEDLRGRVQWGGLVVMLGIVERKKEHAALNFASDMRSFVEEIRDATGKHDLPLIISQYEEGAYGDFDINKYYGMEIARQIDSLPSLLENVVVVPTDWSVDTATYVQDSHHYNCLGHLRWAEEAVNLIVDASLVDFVQPDTVAPPQVDYVEVRNASCKDADLYWPPVNDDDAIGYAISIPGLVQEMNHAPGHIVSWDSATGNYRGSVRSFDWAGNGSEPVFFSVVHPNGCDSSPFVGVVSTPIRIDFNGVPMDDWTLPQRWSPFVAHGGEGDVSKVKMPGSSVPFTDWDLMYGTAWQGPFIYRFRVSPNDYLVSICSWKGVSGVPAGNFDVIIRGEDTTELEVIPRAARPGMVSSRVLCDSILTVAVVGDSIAPVVSGLMLQEHPGFLFARNTMDTLSVGDTVFITWSANRGEVWDANIYVSPDHGVNWYGINETGVVGREDPGWGRFGWKIADSLGGLDIRGRSLSFKLENYDKTHSSVLSEALCVMEETYNRAERFQKRSIVESGHGSRRVVAYDLSGRQLPEGQEHVCGYGVYIIGSNDRRSGRPTISLRIDPNP